MGFNGEQWTPIVFNWWLKFHDELTNKRSVRSKQEIILKPESSWIYSRKKACSVFSLETLDAYSGGLSIIGWAWVSHPELEESRDDEQKIHINNFIKDWAVPSLFKTQTIRGIKIRNPHGATLWLSMSNINTTYLKVDGFGVEQSRFLLAFMWMIRMHTNAGFLNEMKSIEKVIVQLFCINLASIDLGN